MAGDEPATGDLNSFRRDLGTYPPDLGNLLLCRSIDSTNALARRLARLYAAEGLSPPTTILAALHQSSGRGRLGRRWTSPAGGGVYVSILRRLDDGEQPPLYPLLVAVGLCEGLNRWLDGRCRLKWPNDLVVDGRKIGGILIESLAGAGSPVLVAGFGVNHRLVSGKRLPKATWLADEVESPPSLGRLAAALLEGVARRIRHSDSPEYAIAAYERWTLHRAGDVLRCSTPEGVVEGKFLGFDGHGLLRLESGRGERRLAAADLID